MNPVSKLDKQVLETLEELYYFMDDPKVLVEGAEGFTVDYKTFNPDAITERNELFNRPADRPTALAYKGMLVRIKDGKVLFNLKTRQAIKNKTKDFTRLYNGGMGRRYADLGGGGGIIPILRQHYAAQGAR